MTSAYNKRMKGSWRQGKSYKGDGEERQFVKAEIKQQLAEAEHDYLDRYHKGARTKNMKARLTYRIRWYEEAIGRGGPDDSWWKNYLRSALVKAKASLARYLEMEKK